MIRTCRDRSDRHALVDWQLAKGESGNRDGLSWDRNCRLLRREVGKRGVCMCGKSGACAPVESAGAQVLVAAGLMTDVPPCNIPKGAVAKTCLHHSAEWLRIRCRIVVRASREDSDRMTLRAGRVVAGDGAGDQQRLSGLSFLDGPVAAKI